MKVEFIKGGVFDSKGKKHKLGDIVDIPDEEAEMLRDKQVVRRAGVVIQPKPKTSIAQPSKKNDDSSA